MKRYLLLFLLLVVYLHGFSQNLAARRKKIDSIFKAEEQAIRQQIDYNNARGKTKHLSKDETQDVQVRDSVYNYQLRTLDPQKILIYRVNELDTLLGPNREKFMVTPSNFNKIIQNKFETLSGTEIKNGKYYGSSVSVDTKSITVNISIKPSSTREFYLLPTFSGSSNNGFTTVITGDKYSKTLTGGLNFIFLAGNNASRFKPDASRQLHTDLLLIRYHYHRMKPNPDSVFFEEKFNDLQRCINNSGAFILSYFKGSIDTSALSPTNLKELADYKKISDTLIKVKLLPQGFDTLANPYKLGLIGLHPTKDLSVLALKHYLDTADKVQQKAAFSSQHISWWGGGAKYNEANYNVAAPGNAKLVQSFADEYFSANLSWTWMSLLSSGSHFYFSPTYNIQNPHNFNTGSQLHAEVFQNYPIGSVTTQKVSKDITFYPSVPGRLFTNYLLLPFAYYYTKWNVGLELDYKYGRNDVNNDNEDVTFGVLIPIQSDKTAVVVEPLIKAQMLNQKITAFWQNNFAVGINVTVAIPKSFFSK